MSRINYSQNQEQAAILEYFGVFKGKFLDVGAFDGKTLSNTYALLEDGWAGVMVEASPFVFPDLVKNMTDGDFPFPTLILGVVLDDYGLVDFWLDEKQRYFSTADETQAYERGLMTKIKVAAVPDDELLELGPFDFVSVDIEGKDWEFITCCPELLKPARLICAEIGHDEERWSAKRIRAELASQGFTREIYRSPENVILAKP